EDERQRDAREKKADERRLTAEAGHAQLGRGALIGKRAAQVKAVDDALHIGFGFIAQRRPLRFRRQASALTSAYPLTLDRYRLDARRQPVALEKRRQQRDDGREYRQRREQRNEELRIGYVVGEGVQHGARLEIEIDHLADHEDAG